MSDLKMTCRLDIVTMCASCLLLVGAADATGPVYTVREGDTLWGIAQSNGLSCAQLCRGNGRPQDWHSIRPGQKIIVGELLDESGDVSLYAWKTESDIAFDKSNDWLSRNSLFMRRRISGTPDEWRLIMTAEGDWTLADGMSEWCKDRANEARRCFQVMTARMSRDRRFVWMVCNPHIGSCELVCSLELESRKFRVLTDGCAVIEQADGTLFVEGKKTYLPDENGESLGAAWYGLWITPEGKTFGKQDPQACPRRRRNRDPKSRTNNTNHFSRIPGLQIENWS